MIVELLSKTQARQLLPCEFPNSQATEGSDFTASEDSRLDALEAGLGTTPRQGRGPVYTETDLVQAFYGRILAARLEADACGELQNRIIAAFSQRQRRRSTACLAMQRLTQQPAAIFRSRLVKLLRSRSDRAQWLRSSLPWSLLLDAAELAAAQAQGRLLASGRGGLVSRRLS